MGQEVNDSTHVCFSGVYMSGPLPLVHKQFGHLPMMTVPLSYITIAKIPMIDGECVVWIETDVNDL